MESKLKDFFYVAFVFKKIAAPLSGFLIFFMKLLEKLVEIHAPSGEEAAMKDFILDYVIKNQHSWKRRPEIIHGEEFLDCLILVFGKPRTAVFAHMDSVGFTVRYQNQLVPIGGPEVQPGYVLTGKDALGPIDCRLEVDEDHSLTYYFGRGIASGTSLVFKNNFRNTKDYVQSPYLDNRLGVYNALKLAENLENGIIVFSSWEEHGGGSVPILAKYIYENYKVRQALISDITWVTEGVHPGEGAAISMRDRNIPRKAYIDRIIDIATSSSIPFQIEVEGNGSSDGRELQTSPYPFDWCFIGAPEEHVHSPDEKVHKNDIQSMLDLYELLMEKL